MALTEEEKRERRRAWYRKNRESELTRGRAWRAANLERKHATDRAWIAKNYDHKRATEKAWRDNNPERKLSTVNAWRAKNRDHHRAVLEAWRMANLDKVQAAALRARAKAKADPVKRMRNALKAQLNAILRGKASRTGTIATFGYTMEQLVAHLEARFAPGMKWEAYGPKGWHVDHVRPVANFVFLQEDGTVDGEQIKACYALENLQPLWALDNFRKGSRVLT